jgi:hypothetical protein
LKKKLQEVNGKLKKQKNGGGDGNESIEYLTEKKELVSQLGKLMDQKSKKSSLEKKALVKRNWKKKELEMVKEGKKPFFLKKSMILSRISSCS